MPRSFRLGALRVLCGLAACSPFRSRSLRACVRCAPRQTIATYALKARKCRVGSALLRSVCLQVLPRVSGWIPLAAACGLSSLRAQCALFSAGAYATALSNPPRSRKRHAFRAHCVRIEVGVYFVHHHKRDPRQVKRGSKLHNFG